MTRIRVSVDEVAALGTALRGLTDGLGSSAVGLGNCSWALGPGQSAGLLREVLGDFEHQRLSMGRALDHLGDLARGAGAAYVEVEDEVLGWMGGGAW